MVIEPMDSRTLPSSTVWATSRTASVPPPMKFCVARKMEYSLESIFTWADDSERMGMPSFDSTSGVLIVTVTTSIGSVDACSVKGLTKEPPPMRKR